MKTIIYGLLSLSILGFSKETSFNLTQCAGNGVMNITNSGEATYHLYVWEVNGSGNCSNWCNCSRYVTSVASGQTYRYIIPQNKYAEVKAFRTQNCDFNQIETEFGLLAYCSVKDGQFTIR